jgi:hypothetical protein
MFRRLWTVAVVAATAGIAVVAQPAAAQPVPSRPVPASEPAIPTALSTVDPAQRDAVLPAGWRTSPDVALSTAGDAGGLHVLVAAAKDGYTWRTAATLREPGLETDAWVGNACLTGSGTRAVVVYAPRQFTNRANLSGRGAFAAVVDLVSGRVRKLAVGASLAYYDPGCGAGETAVLTQGGADLGRTRLHVVDATTGKVTRRQELAGQVDSAVPVGDQIVAATGDHLFSLAASGARRTLATTRGAPAELHVDASGGIAFLDRPTADTVAADYLPTGVGVAHEVARGPLAALSLAGTGGRLFLTGAPSRMDSLPATMRRLAATAGTTVSSHGGLTFTATAPPTGTPGTGPVGVQATVPATGRSVHFEVSAETAATPSTAATGNAPSPAAVGSPTVAADADRSCAVPRNDPKIQVKKPHWNQVEWAADLAVQGQLTVQRPANWGSSGVPAWSPQGMFPSIPLGGSSSAHVPAQILLGILAQESNLAQASWHALEGETGNPLVGNYYGTTNGGWDIDWSNADCGYGVGQVTDGMRLAGHEKPGETALPANQQKAIALDYATNIAASLRILQAKWNQVHGFTAINDGDPENIENWFAAVWAYNSGVNPQAVTGNTSGCSPGPSCTDDRGNWGLGWGNNPANPTFDFNRHPFLDELAGGSQADAAHPQNWPYQEKVIGFAAFPIVKSDFRDDSLHAGYAQAWWTTTAYRSQAKPPLDTFCTTDDHCGVDSGGQGSCFYMDLHCWWHWNAAWKPDCATTGQGGNVEFTCGFETLTYDAGDPEPPDGTQWPPVCTTAGLPTGAQVVDDQPSSVPPVRAGCTPVATQGTFGLTFDQAPDGTFPSKEDFHQLGGAFDAHFWFAHTYTDAYNAGNHVKVTGTWTLNSQWTGWGRVLVHIPGHGVGTQQADYIVDTGGTATGHLHHRLVNTKSRYVDPQNLGDHWVSLGVFNFAGRPTVTLSNLTRDGDGTQDVAWDAVAFQKLAAKPRDFVVALGDSYISGEGATSDDSLHDYYRETDADGSDPENQNGCHRSRWAWPRRVGLADESASLGSRDDSWDADTDLHFLACSGARSQNVLGTDDPKDGWGNRDADPGNAQEVPQLDAGYLDDDTTLVLLSIGGNDAGFADVIKFCLLADPGFNCQDQQRDGDADVLGTVEVQLIQDQVKNSIDAVLRAVHARAPNAKIVLAGYPRLLDNVACLPSLTFTGVPKGIDISESEGVWLNQMADLLATTEHDLVAANHSAYTVFADSRPSFAGHGVCAEDTDGTDEAAINSIILGQNAGEQPNTYKISQQSFHPLVFGTALYALAVNTALRGAGL